LAIENYHEQAWDTNEAIARYNLSILESQFFNFENAFIESNKSLDIEKRYSALLERGEMLMRRLDFSKAKRDFESANETDESPLSKLNLAIYFETVGRLDEALMLADELLAVKDFSWMYNYGISIDQYYRDVYSILSDIFYGAHNESKFKIQSNIVDKLKHSLYRTTIYFKYKYAQHLYKKFALRTANAFEIEKMRNDPAQKIAALFQYKEAFNNYPSRAMTYLAAAKDIESALNPGSIPAYNYDEGILKNNRQLIQNALESFDPEWERNMESLSLLKLYKFNKTGAARLYKMNKGMFRKNGIKLPVQLEVKHVGEKSNGRAARRLAAYLKKAGFSVSENSGLKLIITILTDSTQSTILDNETNEILFNHSFSSIISDAAGDTLSGGIKKNDMIDFINRLAQNCFVAE
jgi:tetratricopeptide (TPR) repeat protein